MGEEGRPPTYPADDGVKVSAAWLVEHAGFHKDYKRGGAGVSDRHVFALVNRGGNATQLLDLAGIIREGVYGIRLHKEPVIVAPV